MMSHEDFTTQPHTIGISKSPLKFFLLVFVISIPFWLVGFLDLPKILPINLPISALMFVCPTIAALILMPKDNEPNSMRELLKIGKRLVKLRTDEFEQLSIAEAKIKELESKLKYHQFSEVKIIERKIKDEKIIYKIEIELRESQELIASNKNQAGRFILATNILDITELEALDILRVYKQQQSSERGFRFIKDPLFFADSLFVKNPERVETMMMLMGLCLLVYNLGQRQLRMTLKTQKAAVKNQLNKLTERTTLRWIFQCFQGVHVLITQGIQRIINLSDERRRILQFLPASCQKYYFLA